MAAEARRRDEARGLPLKLWARVWRKNLSITNARVVGTLIERAIYGRQAAAAAAAA